MPTTRLSLPPLLLPPRPPREREEGLPALSDLASGFCASGCLASDFCGCSGLLVSSLGVSGALADFAREDRERLGFGLLSPASASAVSGVPDFNGLSMR